MLIKEKLKKIPAKILAFSALGLDLISAWFLTQFWQNSTLVAGMWSKALALKGIQWSELETNMQQELMGMVDMTAASVLVGFLLMNTVFYFYLYLRKKWSWQYVYTYSWTAALLQLATLRDLGNLPQYWLLINIIVMLLYVVLAIVLWLQKSDYQVGGLRIKPS